MGYTIMLDESGLTIFIHRVNKENIPRFVVALHSMNLIQTHLITLILFHPISRP